MNIDEILLAVELGSIFGVVATGIYLTFRVIDFQDLTYDGSFSLGSAVSAFALSAGFNPWLTLLMAFSSGDLAGSVTSFLSINLGITNLLSGILVASMLYSVNLRIMGGAPHVVLINAPSNSAIGQ